MRGCKKDVKPISKYENTGQWQWETCVADPLKPPAQGPPAQCADIEGRMGAESVESKTACPWFDESGQRQQEPLLSRSTKSARATQDVVFFEDVRNGKIEG